MFGCFFLEVCFFLMRDRNGVDPNGIGGGNVWGDVEEETEIRDILHEENNLLSIKEGKNYIATAK